MQLTFMNKEQINEIFNIHSSDSHSLFGKKDLKLIFKTKEQNYAWSQTIQCDQLGSFYIRLVDHNDKHR